MVFASGSELLLRAMTGGYAIGAFNTNNLETTMSIVNAAVAEKSPVILAVSPGAMRYAGVRNLAAIARVASEGAGIPIGLHLDHGLTLEDVRSSLDAGFSSVMIDASGRSFEENIELTGRVVVLAHAEGVSVEAELGRLVGLEGEVAVSDREASMTDQGQAEEFCRRTGIDALAVSIGNAHGWYRGEPKLDLERLRSIRSAVRIPLVLHGASGIPDEMIRQVCDIGIDKINIDTELRHAFKEAVAGFIKANPDEIDPRKILGSASTAMRQVVQKKIRLFGSTGKARKPLLRDEKRSVDMRIALLTGGGDSPATNAAIRAVVRKACSVGFEVVGVMRGWRGLIQCDMAELDLRSVSGIIHRGGTILGTSRTNPFKVKGGVESILENVDGQGIDAIIAIGGDDTNGVAHRLGAYQVKCVGIPQTIDNDLSGTDYSIGFDTAVSIACDALDKLHTTASSHHRVMILEVMGRNAGWIALIAGIAGGADAILVPEVPVDLDDVAARLEKRRRMEKDFSIIIVSEGAKPVGREDPVVQDRTPDDFGHVRLGGIGYWLAEQLEGLTRLETRVTHLGHLQRGGIPTVFDRVLATRLGVFSVDMVREGTFDHMACIRDNEPTALPYSEVLGRKKPIDRDLYELTRIFY